MDKYIKLSDAEAAMRAYMGPSGLGNAQCFINVLRHDVPPAEVMPIIPCGECEHCKPDDERFRLVCEKNGFTIPGHDLTFSCRHGSRKGGPA